MKEKYRDYFASLSFVRFGLICDELGIDRGNFSSFMNGADHRMSVKNLQSIYDLLISKFSIGIKIV